MAETWTQEGEELLEKLRINCINLSEYHRKKYYYYKGYSKYFRIPILILSSLNATTSVGLQTFVEQKWISLTNCVLGMCIGTITAIELYLNITANMDLELTQSKEFYTLGVDIYKTLHLPRNKRGEDDAILYLNKQFSNYTKLKEASNLLDKRLKVDTIASVPNALSISNLEYLNNSEISFKEDDTIISYNTVDEILKNKGKSPIYYKVDKKRFSTKIPEEQTTITDVEEQNHDSLENQTQDLVEKQDVDLEKQDIDLEKQDIDLEEQDVDLEKQDVEEQDV